MYNDRSRSAGCEAECDISPEASVDSTTSEYLSLSYSYSKPVQVVNGDGTDSYNSSPVNMREEFEPSVPVPNVNPQPPEQYPVTSMDQVVPSSLRNSDKIDKPSHPEQHSDTGVSNMDQENHSLPHHSDDVCPASVSLPLEPHEGQEQMRCNSPLMCSSMCTEVVMAGSVKFEVNSIAKAIASLKRTKGHVDQATNQIPVQEDDPCYRCDHMKIFVFLVTCCDATVCENCADEMAKNRDRKRCRFCRQRVGDIIDMMTLTSL